MSRIASKNTKPELVLRKALYSVGLRYRLHVRRLPGTPDIVFHKYKTVVFVDGDWWHGRNYDAEYQKYSAFWQEKIGKNRARDEEVNRRLTSEGWIVIRVWEKDLLKSPQLYAKQIKDRLENEH